MATTERCIVTLNEVKTYMGIDLINEAQDDTLWGWIDLVSGNFEQDTGRKIAVQAVEEVLDGTGTDELGVKYYPIVALIGETTAEQLANLQVRSDWDAAWTDLATNINAIYLDPREPWKIKLLDDSTFDYGTLNIRVNYYAGYEPQASIPADIRKIVIEAVAWMAKESNIKGGGDVLGLASRGDTSTGISSTTSYKDFKTRWDAVVRKHKRYVP